MKDNKKTLKLGSRMGVLGENIACKFLERRGFGIIDRNYRENWGEIDIVAKKADKLWFIEVKSVSCENLSKVSSETLFGVAERVDDRKIGRLKRIVSSYLSDKNVSSETDWSFGLINVLINENEKRAKVNFLEDIIL